MGVQCNVRCTMCYQTDFSASRNMKPALYIDRLRHVYPQLRTVKLIGGEPTIMKNCRDAATLFRQEYPNVKLDVTTNGVFIDDFWHEAFVQQGKIVSISLNAATEATYNKIVILGVYKQAVRNLERILADRAGTAPIVRMSTVILKENVLEIAKFVQLGVDLGVDWISFLSDPILSAMGLPDYAEIRPELEKARAIQEKAGIKVTGLDNFEGHLKTGSQLRMWASDASDTKKMCTMPFTNVVVDWNGDVRVCCNTWVTLGNLNKSSFDELWDGKVATQFRQKMKKGNYLWCSPNCGDNPKPTPLSLVHKSWYRIRENPQEFVTKIRQKSSQLLGTWVKVKDKRKPKPPVAETPALLPILQNEPVQAAVPACEVHDEA